MKKFARTSYLAGLLFALLPACLPALAQTEDESSKLQDDEAQRLRSIIRAYYAEQARHDSEKAAEFIGSEEEVVALAGEDYPPGQVLLSGPQGIKALENMNQRLEDRSMPAQRRQSDMIFHAEVHDNGTLVSSRSHSLKALGQSQYVTLIELPGGEADIVLREERWQLTLTALEPTNFLVTLNAGQNGPPELHLIPVPALQATHWEDFPSWLPPIGASPNNTPGS